MRPDLGNLVFLGLGDIVRWHEGTWEIVAQEYSPTERLWRLVLQATDDPRRVVRGSLATLQSAPDFACLSQGSTKRRRQSFLETLAEKNEVGQMLDHLYEAVIGISPARWARGLTTPRPEYDPEQTNRTQRIETKAKELGTARSWLFELLARVDAEGEQGVLPPNQRRMLTASQRFSPEVVKIVDAVLEDTLAPAKLRKQASPAAPKPRKQASKLTYLEFFRRVNAEIELLNKLRSAEQQIPLLSYSTFHRKADLRYYHWGLTRRAWRWLRNKRFGVTEVPRRFRATHPGQFVLIDLSPFDLIVKDNRTGKPIRLRLLLCVDLFSRSVIAFRLIPRDARAVDAAMLLFDIYSTSALLHRYALKHGVEPAWVGVPQHLILPAIGTVEWVIVDRGPAFRAILFFGACLRFGISVLQARPRTGKDKAQLERLFGTISKFLLVALPGFTGSSTDERGEAVDEDALLFQSEVELLLCAYFVSIHQQTPHDGLRLPGQPQRNRTPNEMLTEGFLRVGLPPVLVDPTLIYECLEPCFKVIGEDGVEIDGLHYHDPVLADWVGQSSGVNQSLWRGVRGVFTNPRKRKQDNRDPWPFRRNPYDLRFVYWQHPDTHEWHPIPCVDVPERYFPFSDLMWAFIRRTAAPPFKGAELLKWRVSQLTELLRRFHLDAPSTVAERRLFQHEAILRAINDRDMESARRMLDDLLPPDAYEPPELLDTDDITEIEADIVASSLYEEDDD